MDSFIDIEDRLDQVKVHHQKEKDELQKQIRRSMQELENRIQEHAMKTKLTYEQLRNEMQSLSQLEKLSTDLKKEFSSSMETLEIEQFKQYQDIKNETSNEMRNLKIFIEKQIQNKKQVQDFVQKLNQFDLFVD